MNLIQQAVERANQMEREGRPVIQPLPPVPNLGSFSTSSGRAYRPAAMASRRAPLGVIGLALLAVLGGALLYIALAQTTGDEAPLPTAPGVSTAPAAPAAAAVATVAAAPARVDAAAPAGMKAPPPQPSVPADPAPATADPMADVRATVADWARAWSDRDVPSYLAFYGDGFVPERGLTRAAWEQSRRQAIERRRNITVKVSNLRLEVQPDQRIVVRYAQDYAADAYRESGTPKRLVLARESAGWRIVSEAADGTPR